MPAFMRLENALIQQIIDDELKPEYPEPLEFPIVVATKSIMAWNESFNG